MSTNAVLVRKTDGLSGYTNQYSSFIDPPDGSSDFKGVEIIGCFGVVGELIVDNPEVIYDYDTQVNEVKNVIFENLTVKQKCR